MNAYPFSLFKRADRSCYSVSFKGADGKLLRPVSTGKKTENEAMQVAFQMLRDGIPQKKVTLKVNDLSLKSVAREIKSGDEVTTLLNELKRLGWVKSCVLDKTPGAIELISFLKSFWEWDTSPYIEEKLRKSHGIHRRHCKQQGRAVTLYWEPFFEGRYLGEIRATDIDAFISHMGEKELSAERRNVIIKAGTKALRWAFTKGKIEVDPTRGHILFSGDKRKRNILFPNVAAKLFRAPWKNERAKLGNMLAAITGIRCGEIQALRFKDIGHDCLYVNGSWNKEDGMKLPKNNEIRTVEVPYPFLIKLLIDQAKRNPWGVSPDSYVFWSETRADMPIHEDCFLNAFRKTLKLIGFTKEQAAEYEFHGWRHFYTAYMVRKLDKKLLKSQTGHKTDGMIDLYGDHEIVGDRETIQATERETFAGLLPEPVLLLEDKREQKPAA